MGGAKPLNCLRRTVFAFFCSIWVLVRVQGQPEVFTFHRVTSREKLSSQSFNYYVYKDSEGFAWISSINGLNRFDGYQVKTYSPQVGDRHALADGNIQSMFFEDTSGNLWFNTVEAIHCYDRKNDFFEQRQLVGTSEGRQKDYQVLWIDRRENELWIREKDTLFIYPVDKDKKQTRVGVFRFSFLSFMQTGEDSSCHLVLPDSTGLKLIRFDGPAQSGFSEYRYGKYSSEFFITTAFLENSEKLWIGGEQGLIFQNQTGGAHQLFSDFQGIPIRGVTGIVPYGADKLLVATRKSGIFIFDKKGNEFIDRVFINEEGRTAPFLYPVERAYLDRDQNLWLSVPGQGVFYTNLEKRKFRAVGQYRSEFSDEMNHVRAMTEDPSGKIWCLTRNGIVVLDKNGKLLPEWSGYQGSKVPFSQGEPFYIFCDDKGRIWVCSQKGLFFVPSPGGEFERVPAPTPLKIPGFTFIRQLSNGRILASSQASGIFEVREKAGRPFLAPLEETRGGSEEFTWIYEDHSQRVFLCENLSNIHVFSQIGEKLLFDTVVHFKPMVNAMVEDPYRQRLWIATSTGMFFSDLTTPFFGLQQDTSFLFQPLNGLLIDEDHVLWATTNHGLIRYLPGPGKNWRIFSLADGLQAWEFNFWSALKTRSGLLAFGGVNGINLIDPRALKDTRAEANPVLTEILVNDHPFLGASCALTGAKNVGRFRKIVLKYYQNSLLFRFSALEYSDPSAVEYRYSLSDVDGNLVHQGKENFARYPDLRPGQYYFHVDASNSDGVWSNRPLALEIVIHPPWYQTRVFRIALVVLGLVLLYLFYRSRINQIRKKEAFLRKEAQYKQLVAETETAVLRLQMNPHFIFNSLNSIHSYIMEKDIETANDYLTRFAKLMRLILKYSEKPYIPVSQEIEFLEKYLETEAMRFEKKFSFSFEVDPALDPDETLIPTMLLQPFVENAIWHGFSGMKGEGLIQVRFKKEDRRLHCTVEDNGVGRGAAQATGIVHESKALSITQRRLELLEKKTGAPTSYEIIDLLDETGRPCGTKVELSLPLL